MTEPDNSHRKKEELTQAVLSYDYLKVRKLLDKGYSATFIDEDNQSLLHLICKNVSPAEESESESNSSFCSSNLYNVIYMLVDAGVDLELTDVYGNTCLYYAALNRNSQLCEVLLQCGADMWIITESGNFLFDCIIDSEGETDLQLAFQKFYPGLWKAVESEDIYQVRRLINLWCKTDLHKDGYSLKDIAFEVGNEGIISLVLGIFESMELVYHILAKNTKAVRKLLESSRKKLRLDLRKMSERGAPILYYLIQSKDVPIIKLFINNGCQVYTVMLDEYGFDMPVLFTALKPDMSADVIEALLPKHKKHQEEMMYKILYKGKTVLGVAFKQNVSLEVFSIIVDRGGPQLIADRNQFNQTVKDLAILNNKQRFADVIDKHVFSWISYPSKYPGRRQHLALYGWDFSTLKLNLSEEKFNENIPAKEFFMHLDTYQLQIKELARAVENGDVEKFKELKTFKHECNIFERNLSWHGKVVGDGLPLLHRAVLFNHPDIVKLILDEKPKNESIDKLFDQHHRTALHYAYARCSTAAIRKLLLDSGCSEHVLDKLNKEPLDFREQQDSLALMELLDRLKLKNITLPEPDPWNNVENTLLEEVPCNNNCGKMPVKMDSHSFNEFNTDSSCDNLSDTSDEEHVEDKSNGAFCSII